MIRGLHSLAESVQLRLGRAPSCAWVEERLAEYSAWDLPMHEFGAIEQHLSRCRACAQAYDEIAPLVDSILEEELRAQLPGYSSARLAAETMARIDAYERARAAAAVATDASWSHWCRYMAAAAVSFVARWRLTEQR